MASAAKAKQDGKRIYDAVVIDADAELKRLAPPQGVVWTDPKNGRWRVRYEGKAAARRSISWTLATSPKACAVALQQLWDWAMEFDGMMIPPGTASGIQQLLA